MTAPTRLVLVRHGESVVTVRRVVGGMATCSGLSPLGVRQAEALAERLAGHGELADATSLVSSTMPRAVQTAEVVAPALGGLAIERIHDLREHDPGEADGLGWDEFVDRYGVPDLERHPHRPLAPGGESLAGFHHRAGRALADLVDQRQGTTTVVVCHGGVIDVAFRSLLGLPVSAPFELHTVNTSLTELVRSPDSPATGAGRGRPGRWRLVRYNDAAHLLDVDDGASG